MDKRFLAWLCLTAALFMLWVSLRPRFLPPPAPGPVAGRPAPRDAEKSPEEQTLERQPASGEVVADDGNQATEKPIQPEVASSATWHTLGSYAANDGYRLVVTLTNRGAGIERIELVEQAKPGSFRYRSIENEHGYPGYLAVHRTPEGIAVGCVPKGSPASLATPQTSPNGTQIGPGLAAGDVLRTVNGQAIQSTADWDKALHSTKPRQKMSVTVERSDNNGQPQSLDFDVLLTEMPKKVVHTDDEILSQQAPGNRQRPSLLTTLATLDGRSVEAESETLRGLDRTLHGLWAAKPIPNGIEFTLPVTVGSSIKGEGARLEMVKRFTLPIVPEGQTNELMGYDLHLETLIRNLDDLAHEVSFRQEGFNGVTLEGWWYLTKISPYMFEGAGARDVVYASEAQGHRLISCRSIFKSASLNPLIPSTLFISQDLPEPRRDLKYAGVDAQFFAAAVMPSSQHPDAMRMIPRAASVLLGNPREIPGPKQMASNVGFWFETPIKTLEPKGELASSYRLFAGPKDPDVLSAYGLSRCIEFGWFEWVAKPLSWLLHGFYSISRNYGIAIVMLTVLVRGCMFPISRRAAISAQRMQEIAPELRKISEQYKDDWEKRSKATQEIYRKYKFNPMAGCLPVFLQIPIFIGLYRAVSIDIKLRQQPLLPGVPWCSNLAGPDQLLDWSHWMPDFIAGMGTGWFGPFLNILPLVTVTLFVIQQKVLMPKATDEQMQMQQTMMMYMTLFMGVLFFKVPAGLCIYFITSSLWSLVERQLVKRTIPPIQPGKANTEATTQANQADRSYTPREKKRPKAPKPPEKLSDVLPWLRDKKK